MLKLLRAYRGCYRLLLPIPERTKWEPGWRAKWLCCCVSARTPVRAVVGVVVYHFVKPGENPLDRFWSWVWG